MRVVHWTMVYTDGRRSVYATHITDCRRTRDGGWSGRIIHDTGARLTAAPEDDRVELRARMDALARSEATRLKLPAGPDHFPFRPGAAP